MSQELKDNLKKWLTYSILCYIILIPFQVWIIGVSLSILIGFLFGLLNEILSEIKKLKK